MDIPYQFTIICRKTKEVTETNFPPLLRDLQTWELAETPNRFKLIQTKDCWIDTRYAAKRRLFEYLHPEYKQRNPYEGTEIGKTISILNF
jgi:hypothetical protein